MRFGGLARRGKHLIDRAFRERQIFLRSGTRVAFTTLSRRRQIALTALVSGFVLWSLYASVVYFSYDSRLAASEARFLSARSAYEHAIVERDAAIAETRQSYRSFLAALAHPFELLGDARIESRQELAALRGRNAKLALDIGALERELAASRAESERLAQSEEALSRRRDALAGELVELKARNGKLDGTVAALQGELAASRARRQASEANNLSLSKALDESRAQAADEGRRNAEATSQIATLEAGLASLGDERSKLSEERTSLSLHVEDLQQKLATLQADQNALIARLSERATNRSVAVERAIAMTGLDVKKLLAEAGTEAWSRHASKSGAGGPFVAYRPERDVAGKTSARSGDIELVVSALDKEEERHEGLKRILARLPLASPIDGYRIVSDFGPRIDPINGRLAMHEGVDLTSEPGAKVLATAPGVVVFAGWDGTYGKLVEINHGMGVRTRYAHLKSIVVEVGSKVATRTEVGIIGSTGRSTGTHVHYEVLVDDKHYDPVKFIKAGEYVFSKD